MNGARLPDWTDAGARLPFVGESIIAAASSRPGPITLRISGALSVCMQEAWDLEVSGLLSGQPSRWRRHSRPDSGGPIRCLVLDVGAYNSAGVFGHAWSNVSADRGPPNVILDVDMDRVTDHKLGESRRP